MVSVDGVGKSYKFKTETQDKLLKSFSYIEDYGTTISSNMK